MLVDLTAIKQLLLPRFCLPSGPDLLECLFKSESSRPKYLSAACMQKVKSQYAIKGLAKGTKEADDDATAATAATDIKEVGIADARERDRVFLRKQARGCVSH